MYKCLDGQTARQVAVRSEDTQMHTWFIYEPAKWTNRRTMLEPRSHAVKDLAESVTLATASSHHSMRHGQNLLGGPWSWMLLVGKLPHEWAPWPPRPIPSKNERFDQRQLLLTLLFKEILLKAHIAKLLVPHRARVQ